MSRVRGRWRWAKAGLEAKPKGQRFSDSFKVIKQSEEGQPQTLGLRTPALPPFLDCRGRPGLWTQHWSPPQVTYHPQQGALGPPRLLDGSPPAGLPWLAFPGPDGHPPPPPLPTRRALQGHRPAHGPLLLRASHRPVPQRRSRGPRRQPPALSGPQASGGSREPAQAHPARSSAQTMGCTEPGVLTGPRTHPAPPSLPRSPEWGWGGGQHSGALEVRALRKRGGDRHGEGTGTDGGAGETHAAQSARPHLCGARALSLLVAAAPRGPPPRAWPGRAPVSPSLRLGQSVRPSGVACSATAPRPRDGGEGPWMTSAPPRPPGPPKERAREHQALRSAGVGAGAGAAPSLHPVRPPPP